MSKKDLELIAATIQRFESLQELGSAPDIAELFADALAGQADGRFNRARFLRACVPGANVRART